MNSLVPDLGEQQEFWDNWNAKHRQGELDAFMQRQSEVALAWMNRCSFEPKRILEVGCGTGWLASRLSACAPVVGVDLSARAIEQARRRYPEIKFQAGDFQTLALHGPFGCVVSADVIGHVADQEGFIARIASLLQPGGLFLLMTQNAFVWNRSSYLMPQGKAQIRNWPTLSRIRRLMAHRFKIVHVSSIVPGGDRGIFRVVNGRIVKRVLRAAIGTTRMNALYEWARVGRELIIVARRT